MNKTKALIVGGAALMSLLMAVPAFAATDAADGSDAGAPSTNTVKKGTHKPVHKPKPQTQQAMSGTIASVNGSSFTISHKLKTASSTITVKTSSTTVFVKNRKAATINDLVVGKRVVVFGTRDSAGTITAKRVDIAK